MTYTQVKASGVSAELSEILIAEFAELGFDGFEEYGDFLVCSITTDRFNKQDVEALLSRFEVEYELSEVEEQNWNALWESNFEPVLVEDFAAIRADFHPPFNYVQFDLVITPKMSFGTGHHATTYMMIRQMKDLDFKNTRVADFGTGTGILAILAEKMGASHVDAIDEDEWSIENAKENLDRNNCCSVSLLKANSFVASANYDIILANINRNIILENLPQLSAAIKPGGKLLLSGLLISDQQDIIEASGDQKLQCLKVDTRNNWISILLDRI